MDYPTLMEFFKLLFEAPLNTVLVLSGILFLLLGIIPIHKISIKGISAGRISQQWRVVSAVAGACLIILGVALTIYTPPDVNQGTTPATSCLGAPRSSACRSASRAGSAQQRIKSFCGKVSPKARNRSDRLSPGTYFAVEDGPVLFRQLVLVEG